jgi:TolB-like protein/AraC-like DNA-binding protein
MTAPAPSNTEFIKKLREITLANLSDEKFGVNELAQEIGMNYFSLNRKLHSAIKKTVSQFITEVRLEKAKEILEQEDHLTASEVAFKVGFGSPAYFSRCFHEHFGYPPGEIRKRGLNDQSANNDNSSFNPKTEQEVSENRPEQQSSVKKPGLKGVVFVSAGILILAILASFYFFQIFNHSLPVLNPADKSIAVLPFKNLSNDQNNQYFADGVMEDILNLLYRVGEFRVISRTSVEQFRGSTKSTPEIAKKLGVNFILEGSVQRYDNKVRVNVQLIDSRHDRQILSEKYDREFADIFAIQSGIAKQVADQLQTALLPNEIKEIEKIPTKNTEAYNLYLQGRFFWNRRTKEGVEKSIEYFEKAVKTDPDYALAWAGLADAYMILTGYGWYIPKKEGQNKVKIYLRKALDLDKNLAEAHATLGHILAYDDWNWKEAEKELNLAIRLNPKYAQAHHYYAQLLDIFGDYEKARDEIDLALKLDPLSPIMHRFSATLYYNDGNFDESLKEYQEVLSLEKNFQSAHWWIFFNYYRLGEGRKALDELHKILLQDTLNTKYIDETEKVYDKSGLDGLINWMNEIYPDDAALFALAGKKEEALTYIEGYLKNSPGGALVRLINYRDFETLRAEPRFKAVVDKLGLTKYYLKRLNDPGYIKK